MANNEYGEIVPDELWLCATCGVEHAPAAEPPSQCAICEDERQYVPPTGQRWTTLPELRGEEHRVEVNPVDEHLWGIRAPGVGIGQQGMLIHTPDGNLLFDVPGLIDDDAVRRVRDLGGIRAIVGSHPHMYGAQSAWSAAFDDAPIWVADVDAHWLGCRPSAVRTWTTSFEVLPGVVLDHVGGHFPGSTIALWSAGAGGRGVLFAGDAIFPVPDGNVTFLRSYPNSIPLSAGVIERIAAHVSRYDFDVLYSNFGSCIESDAAATVQRSAQRYIAWVSGMNDHLT